MATTPSVTKLSGVLAAVSETFGDFHAESAEIEEQFFDLIEEIAAHHTAAAGDSLEAASGFEASASEKLEDLDRSLAQQRKEFCGKQAQLSDDVGQLRDLVEQQVELLSKWITASPTPAEKRSPRRKQRNSAEGKVSQSEESVEETASPATRA